MGIGNDKPGLIQLFMWLDLSIINLV